MALAVLAALTLCAVLLPATAEAQEWTGSNRARGVILTQDDVPIPDATVKIYWDDDENSGPPQTTASKKGRWAFVGVRPGTWTIVVEAEGYVPWKSQISVFGAGDLEKIKLREVPAEVKDAQRRERANELLLEGNTLNESGKHAEAREAFERVLADLVDKERTTVIYAIANTYVLEENHEAAVEKLNEALALEPDHVDSLRLMIAILVAEGKDDEAEVYLAKLPEDAELDPQAQINLGISRYNEGNMEEAESIFMKVLETNPDMAEALYFAGLVHLNQQKNDMARSELERFVELAPDHPKAAEAREFISYLPAPEGR